MSEQIKTGVCVNGEQEIEFHYVTELTTEQKMVFVSELSNLVVLGGNYYSFAKDVMFKFMVIRVFTDVDTSFIEEDGYDNKLNMIDHMVFNTNICDIVINDIDYTLIKELYESFEYNIEYKTGIHRTELDKALGSIVSTIEEKIENINVDEMLNAINMLGGMSGEFTPERMLEAFANTDIYKKNRE